MARGSAGTKGEGTATRAAALDPSTPLSLRDAAVLAGVEESVLAERCDDGSLLFETRPRGRKEVRVVRLVDLAELFPEVLGRAPATDGEAPADGRPAADVGSDDPGDVGAGLSGAGDGDPGAGDLVEAVRESGASRDALIGLARDLEDRLDLAERERRASTASLLMAQRRILDLELQSRRRPLARAGAAALALLSVTAIVVAAGLPAAVREAARDEVAGVRAAVASDLEGLADRVEGAVGDAEAARAELAERVSAGAAVVEDGRRAMEDVSDRARRELDAAARERAERAVALASLEERLRSAESEAARRAAELDLLVEGASRDRARFAERLAAAERSADDARARLAEERRASAAERAAFERTLADLLADGERLRTRDDAELRRLREAIEEALRERDPVGAGGTAGDGPPGPPDVPEPEARGTGGDAPGPVGGGPTPWRDALRALFGESVG